MLIYHGSPQVVDAPSLGAGRPDNDYGRGFYCTQDLALAKEWACKRRSDGFANTYEFDAHGLKALDLLDGSHSVLEWISLLLAHRTFDLESGLAADARDYLSSHFCPSLEGVDFVVGYRADDSYYSFAESFVSNALPLRSLDRALRLGRLGEQTVLVSEAAFQNLAFVEAEPVDASQYYPRFKSRDERARRQWREDVRGASAYRDDLFVMDILREGVTADDPRVRRVLSARG